MQRWDLFGGIGWRLTCNDLFPEQILRKMTDSIWHTRSQWFRVETPRWQASNFAGEHTVAHDDVIKWKHFPRSWPFVRGIHQSPANSPHKSQWRGNFDVFVDLRLNKRLSKQWWGWWFETPSRPLWRHSTVIWSTRIDEGNEVRRLHIVKRMFMIQVNWPTSYTTSVY